MNRKSVLPRLLVFGFAPWAAMAQTPSGSRLLYSNDFSSAATLAADFTILDFSPVKEGPSEWSVTGGVLKQASNIYGPVTVATGIPYEKGTFLLLKEGLSGDWDMQVKVKAADNDGLGLVFNFADTSKFNWVEWDAQDSILAFCRSGNRVNTGTILASAKGANPFKNSGYQKPTSWEKAQGLASDGSFYYFAGHHDADSMGADIHIIRKSDHVEIKSLWNVGPMHSAELDMFGTRGTLLACSGGDGRHPYVWELGTADGARLNAWDFRGTGENGGALVAWAGGDDILLFTSSSDGAEIAFTRVTLGSGGAKTIGKTWRHSATDLGVPQGMDYTDGYVYYLADAGPTVKENPHFLYKIKLDSIGTGITVVEKYRVALGEETEGLDISPDYAVSFGSAEEKIYLFDQPLQLLSPDPGGYLPGIWYTLRVEKVASRYKVYVDGDLRLSLTENTYSSGRPGLISRGSTGLQYDDFRISVPAPSATAEPSGRRKSGPAMPARPGRDVRRGAGEVYDLAGRRVGPMPSVRK